MSLTVLLGGPQFAVILILFSVLYFLVSTICEVPPLYQSKILLALGGALFLSVFLAILNRLPFKKHLIAFYLSHIGILIILIGSYLTYFLAIDGNMILYPNIANGKIEGAISQLSSQLPFQLELKHFTIEMEAASKVVEPKDYASYLYVLDDPTKLDDTKIEGKKTEAKISMNRPLKYQGFRFYQSSYFQTSDGSYASVLSVNYDPGRYIKYLGSLLVILGAFVFFYYQRKE